MVVCTKSYVTLITPVIISYQPQNRSVPIGGTTNIFVVANSMTPITYQWYLNGIVLPGSTNSNLVISNAQLANEGNYTVTLQNAVGSVTSSAATLTVIYPPVILASPVSQTVNQGSTVNLEVLADGSQPMTYTWLFNGAPIVGPNTRILTIQNAQPAQAGKYSVLCSNLYGTATSAQATLQVMPIPVITQQPAVTIVTVSNTFQLSVTATGTGTLTYQWFQNGSIVPGATASTYGNTNAQYANAGTYTVSVANAYGTVISQPAILLVLPTQPEKIPTNPSQPIIVQVVFTPDGNTALIYYGAIGSNYVIEATSDLNTWTTVTNITPTVNLNQFIDNNATNYTQRYYRVGLVK
jgi:hypothetical protein